MEIIWRTEIPSVGNIQFGTLGTNNNIPQALRSTLSDFYFPLGHVDDGTFANLIEWVALSGAVDGYGFEGKASAEVDAPYLCRTLGKDVGIQLGDGNLSLKTAYSSGNGGRNNGVSTPAMVTSESGGIVERIQSEVEVANRDDGVIIA